jgi:hypothetical protein
MGLLDTILGRSKPVRANLDALFALPSAAVTLQVSCGLVPTGRAGVCFKPPAGQPFAEMQAELEQLLRTPDDPAPPQGASASPSGAGSPAVGPASGASAQPTVRHVGDKFGYRWIIVEADATDDLVTRVHMVHSSLQDAGWSTLLLCSVFGFTPVPADASAPDMAPGAPDAAPILPPEDLGGQDSAVHRPLYLVYLAKQGTFYPFAPSGTEQRDTELELRIRSVVEHDLPIEADLSRWFPIWDIPIA